MIGFVYHDLEPENDNDDPFLLDESQLDWTRYDSDLAIGEPDMLEKLCKMLLV